MNNRMNKLLQQACLASVGVFVLAGQAMADSLAEANRIYAAGDYAKAAKLYALPAKRGDADAQYILGVMYRAGRGVDRDLQQAEKWYRLAAEQGHAQAQFNLGWMYAGGKGVPQDRVRSQMWFNIAIANAGSDARKEFIVDRDSLAKSMSADQLAKARELSGKCTAKKFRGC